VLHVAGIGAVRGPGESVVTTGKDLDAAPVHLAQAIGGGVEFLLVADGLGDLLGEAEGLRLVQGGDDESAGTS
jgi:hypothetical protein